MPKANDTITTKRHMNMLTTEESSSNNPQHESALTRGLGGNDGNSLSPGVVKSDPALDASTVTSQEVGDIANTSTGTLVKGETSGKEGNENSVSNIDTSSAKNLSGISSRTPIPPSPASMRTLLTSTMRTGAVMKNESISTDHDRPEIISNSTSSTSSIRTSRSRQPDHVDFEALTETSQEGAVDNGSSDGRTAIKNDSDASTVTSQAPVVDHSGMVKKDEMSVHEEEVEENSTSMDNNMNTSRISSSTTMRGNTATPANIESESISIVKSENGQSHGHGRDHEIDARRASTSQRTNLNLDASSTPVAVTSQSAVEITNNTIVKTKDEMSVQEGEEQQQENGPTRTSGILPATSTDMNVSAATPTQNEVEVSNDRVIKTKDEEMSVQEEEKGRGNDTNSGISSTVCSDASAATAGAAARSSIRTDRFEPEDFLLSPNPELDEAMKDSSQHNETQMNKRARLMPSVERGRGAATSLQKDPIKAPTGPPRTVATNDYDDVIIIDSDDDDDNDVDITMTVDIHRNDMTSSASDGIFFALKKEEIVTESGQDSVRTESNQNGGKNDKSALPRSDNLSTGADVGARGGTPTQSSPASAMTFPVGTKLLKSRIFHGEVITTPDPCGGGYYKVEFTDGDTEEYELEELLQILKDQDETANKVSIGTKVAKEFEMKSSVIKVPRRGSSVYKIKFEYDNKEEDIEAGDLAPLVRAYEEKERGSESEGSVMALEDGSSLLDHPSSSDAMSSSRKKNSKGNENISNGSIVLGKKRGMIAMESSSSSQQTGSSMEETRPESTVQRTQANDGGEEVQLVSDSLSGLSQVKIEMFNKSIVERGASKTYQDRMFQKEKRMNALKTPDGKPRRVFRRGCHKACITKVLGGSGMYPAPKVKKPPKINPDGTNPFIKKGEFYFAGDYLWNSWTPSFPGAVGCIESWCLVSLTKQETFHCFVQCSKKSEKHWPNYLGPKAEGKRLYLGRYREVPFDNDDEEPNIVGHIFPFKNLSWQSQIHMCKEYHKYSKKEGWMRKFEVNGEEKVASDDHLEDRHFERAKEFAEGEKEGSWDLISADNKVARAWVEMLLELEYFLKIVPIEYVDYDEALYEKLVEIGADSGEVSLDESELGPL